MASSPHIEFKGLLSFLILHELSSESLFGDQLAERIGSRKGEKLTPGTIYPALKKLRKFKLVIFAKDGRRKVYSLTPSGKAELGSLYRIFGRYFAGLGDRVEKRRVFVKPAPKAPVHRVVVRRAPARKAPKAKPRPKKAVRKVARPLRKAVKPLRKAKPRIVAKKRRR